MTWGLSLLTICLVNWIRMASDVFVSFRYSQCHLQCLHLDIWLDKKFPSTRNIWIVRSRGLVLTLVGLISFRHVQKDNTERYTELLLTYQSTEIQHWDTEMMLSLCQSYLFFKITSCIIQKHIYSCILYNTWSSHTFTFSLDIFMPVLQITLFIMILIVIICIIIISFLFVAF